jgi:hypothetical protein
MAILANSTVRTVLQIVLAVVIIVLGYVLYETIRGPQREFAREQELTDRSRVRMDYLRRALVAYNRQHTGFPSTLDSLQQVITQDSLFVARRDSIFGLREGQTLPPLDSLVRSTRGPLFEYEVVRDDTANVWVYLIRDPATGDSIGTADARRAVGLRHAASWE